jgi:hypothetical protein
MVDRANECTFRQSRRDVLPYLAGCAASSAGLILKARSSEAYTAAAFYVFAALVGVLAIWVVPWLIVPDKLSLSDDGIVWRSVLRRKTMFSARWSDLEAVGIHRPKPTTMLGVTQDRPVMIGFRFRNGRLPQELKARGAGAIDFGQWSWTIPSRWNASPDEIVERCLRHLRIR